MIMNDDISYGIGNIDGKNTAKKKIVPDDRTKRRRYYMKFVMAYSCGKDSTLALHKMIEQGHEPVGLIVMINEEADRSYFHGADDTMLDQYSKSLGIPLIPCPTKGENYPINFEKGLLKAKAMGAEAACFGDIDIWQNRQWEEERCINTGLTPVFPLWQIGRKESVREIIGSGYKCLIKSINTNILPKTILGKYLDEDSVSIMEKAGIDICGENGEYHTLVTDGPIFKKSLDFYVGDILEFGDYAVVDIGVRSRSVLCAANHSKT